MDLKILLEALSYSIYIVKIWEIQVNKQSLKA